MAMRRINWFRSGVWLANLRLRDGELVLVDGRVYRYELERQPDGSLQHTLTPEVSK